VSFGEAFLANPDLFPGRPAGERWGDGEAALGFAGLAFHLAGLGESHAQAVEARFGGLPAPEPGAPAVPVRLFRAHPADFRHPDLSGRLYDLALDFGPDRVRLAGLDLMGLLEWGPSGPAAAVWTPLVAGPAFLGALENALRVLAAYRLLEAGGVLLHSAGLVSGGEAYVLFGPSGAGKTTAARLSAGVGRRVLSDDLNALLPAAGGPRVRQVPFAGDLGRAAVEPGSFPLRRLCRLEQGDGHRLRPLGPAAALASLLASAPFVNADPFRFEALADRLAALAAAVPVEVLTFRKEAGFWDTLTQQPC
jgi:hypothetical protein